MSKKTNKNVSKKIPNGRIIQTRDEFFEGSSEYRKPNYGKKGNYRKSVVVDSNNKDELALVKLTTSEKGESLEDYKNGKSRFRPFVETTDDKGKPIKIDGKKFVSKPKSNDMSLGLVARIKRTVFKKSKKSQHNRKKVRKMKGR